MKLPRNARIFRGQLDAAAFIGVCFLLLIFFLLNSRLVFTPGIRIALPEVPQELSGSPHPSVVVAMDRSGLLYYEGQVITPEKLKLDLRRAVKETTEPLTLE